MSYEALATLCQLVAMVLFGAVMAGVLFHVLRPANRRRFEAAARTPLGHEEIAETSSQGHQSHGQ